MRIRRGTLALAMNASTLSDGRGQCLLCCKRVLAMDECVQSVSALRSVQPRVCRACTCVAGMQGAGRCRLGVVHVGWTAAGNVTLAE
jgi:hypothetical protein